MACPCRIGASRSFDDMRYHTRRIKRFSYFMKASAIYGDTRCELQFRSSRKRSNCEVYGLLQ